MAMKYGSTSSCTVVGHGTRSEYQCRIGYEIVSENTSTNKREVKLQLEARTTSSSYTTWGVSQTPTIDGKKLSSSTLDLRKVNSWKVLGTRIITITGAFSGKKVGSFTVDTSSEWSLKSGSASVTLDLDDLHTPPVVNSVDLVEKNTQLNSYTGIVQFLSTKNITFDTSTYDDATISSYQVQHNGVLIGSSTSNGMTINFDNVGTLATFEMNGKTYATFKFIVIDSYGTSSSLEQQIEVIKYSKPNLVQTSSSVKRNGQLTGKVKLNLIGSFFNQSINGVANTISLKFAYWKKGDDESTTYYNIPFTASDNNINISDWNVAKNGTEISDISKDYAYMFKIIATDHFNKKSEITLLCPVGEYLWAEFKDRVDFKNITIQGESLIKEITSDGDAIKTGRKINGKDEYTKYTTFTFGGSTNTWYAIAQIPQNARITGFYAQVEAGGNDYTFPFSYPNISTKTTQAITTYYERATGTLSAQFNYSYIGNRDGEVYISYVLDN